MLNENIFFSIIIPTYNHSFFLDKALGSVVQQTFKNFEVIVIDNFSKDKTAEVVLKNQNYCNIVYKKIHNNGVIGESRNFGIKIAKGNWLAFLDSDDLWHPEKLKKIYKYIKKKSDYQIFCNDEIILKNNKKSYSNYGPFVKNFYQNLLTEGNCISTSGSIVNKKFLLEKKIFFSKNKNFITAEDYDFFLNLAKVNAKFYFIKEFLGEHNYYKGSASSDYHFHKKAVINVLKYHIDLMTYKEKKMISSIFFNIDFKDVFFYAKNKKLIKALRLFINLIYKNPLNSFLLIFKKIKNLYKNKFILE
jgi:glycosyltransferase involved in cell wall biosynthesis